MSTKLTVSRLILLSIATPSAAIALTLGTRPNLTQYQIHLLETASQICYASTATLISLESTRKAMKKPLPPANSPKPTNLNKRKETPPDPTQKDPH